MSERLQIKLEFNSIEDRLLLRIFEKRNHASGNEYRFWLTRRFVNILIKAFDKLLGDALATDMQVSPETKAAMKKFQQEAALSKADFSTMYGANGENCNVIGEKPLLVTTVRIKKKSKGNYVISLLTTQKTGMHLTAGMEIIHSLQKMLVDSVHNAAWNQSLLQTTEEECKTIDSAGYIS